MKKLLSFLLMIAVVFVCFANGKVEAVGDETPVQTAIRNAAGMSWDDLLEKAKAEIGDNELLILASTSRFDEKTFTEKTGIKVKATNLDPSSIFEKVDNEIGNGVYSCDIITATDSYNMDYALENGWAENFIPDAYAGYLAENEKKPLVLEYYNRVYMYNNDNGTLSNRITNVWQFVEPELKNFEIKNPLMELGTMYWLITLTSEENQSKLAEAYRNFYGKEWVNDGTYKNISYQWIHGFLKNATFNNKDSGIVKNLGSAQPGAVGVAVFSKFRSGNVASIGVSAFEGVDGFAGFLFPLSMTVAFNAKYPYAACLYVNYCLSEEGFMNIFGKDMGGYSINPNAKLSEKAIESGDRDLSFWKECLIVEDLDYIKSVYAEAYTQISQWCADK